MEHFLDESDCTRHFIYILYNPKNIPKKKAEVIIPILYSILYHIPIL